MSFRQDNKKNKRWRNWLSEHHQILMRCGLPDFILESETTWIHFLQEGYDVPTGWKSSMLNTEQQMEFYKFIRQIYGNETHRVVLHDLEVVLGNALSSTNHFQ